MSGSKSGARSRLEVNPETPRVRKKKRIRNARFGVRMATLILGLIFVSSLGKVLLEEVFYRNDKFAVKEIVITTDGDLSYGFLLGCVEVQEGDNLLKLPLEELSRKLEALPQVKEARVDRKMPGRLLVDVLERRPVAWLESQGLRLQANALTREELSRDGGFRGGVLLDAEGVLLPAEVMLKHYESLPVIAHEGCPPQRLGEVCTSEVVQGALVWLSGFERFCYGHKLEVQRLAEVREYGLEVSFEEGLRALFSLQEFATNLEGGAAAEMKRFAAIMKRARAEGWAMESLNMMVRDHIPVRFAGRTER